MKKLKLIILGLGMLISLAVYGNNIDIASAAENETSTQTEIPRLFQATFKVPLTTY